MAFFEKTLAIRPSTRVLDVGGTPFNWSHSATRPAVTLVNLATGYVGAVDGKLRLVVADGCALPFRDASFDVVFCNSVIEHVQPGAPRAQLASEIRRVGCTYFVETPNKWFPVEPHFLAPLFQFLPRALRRRTVRFVTPWGWITRPSSADAARMVDEISLLDRAELQFHFPDGEVVSEKLLGLPKSLIVLKRM